MQKPDQFSIDYSGPDRAPFAICYALFKKAPDDLPDGWTEDDRFCGDYSKFNFRAKRTGAYSCRLRRCGTILEYMDSDGKIITYGTKE